MGHIDIDGDEEEEGEQCGPPGDDEHAEHTHQGTGQRHPHIVVLEGGPKAWESVR